MKMIGSEMELLYDIKSEIDLKIDNTENLLIQTQQKLDSLQKQSSILEKIIEKAEVEY